MNAFGSSDTSAALHEAVDALAPFIRERADEAERARRLSSEVAIALRDAGLFRMLRPASRGGFELDPVSEFAIAEHLAGIDAAAAWNVQVCNASELYGGWFDDGASKEIYGSPDAVVAGAFNPKRRAVAVEGGYRVSGRTPFNSNCHAATWLIGLADVCDGDTPRLDDEGLPTVLLTATPASECRIVENWDTLGMCATGSHDVAIDDVFVPAERAVPFGPLEKPSPDYDTSLSRLAMWVTVGAHASVALGIAGAAMREAIELGTKVPAYTDQALRNRPRVQLRLAQADARLASARAFFYDTYASAWEAVEARGELTLAEKARCQQASSSAVLAAAEVVDLVHACVGTSGIRQGARFERHFRDVHVITQHAFVAEARLEAVGQIMLGLEPDWGFFAF